MPDHIYEKAELIQRLDSCLGKAFGEIDDIGLFDRVQGMRRQKGIAGAVVEQCVFGYPPDSSQEADLIILDGEDRVKTELKTTGVVINELPTPHFVAKEPMSITAVGVYDIAVEEFWTSHFWQKLEHMLIVYYHYASETAVSAYGYREFKISGYEFHEFGPEEVDALKSDWEHVHSLCEDIVSHYPGVRTEAWKKNVKEEYIERHGQLRRYLNFIDLAPKFPPRFRLKKPMVSILVAKHFGYELEQLPGRYNAIADIDKMCRNLTAQYSGKTILQLARLFDISYSPFSESKCIAERIIVAMFGGTATKMNHIEDFSKFGLIAKSVVTTSTGKRTEDMKLFHIDFSEITKTVIEDEDGAERTFQFEDSELYSYFADHEFLCIEFQEPPHRVVRGPAGRFVEIANRLGENRFMGFKRVVFSAEFIDTVVKPVWEDIREKIFSGTLVDVIARKKDGSPVFNKSGGIRSAPNFIKSSESDIFVRGSGVDSSEQHKTECVNGIKMLPQYIWLKGSAIVKELEQTPKL